MTGLIISRWNKRNLASFALLALSIGALGAGKDAGKETCTRFLAPFDDEQREAYESVRKRVISEYGAHRDSYAKGHKHSGIDLLGSHSESVLPICPGTVVDIHLGFPHRTILVEHTLAEGNTIYSSYKHVEDIAVRVGEKVGEDTRLARLFTATEQKRAGFEVNHLHLEIRHSIDDGGAASWTSMSMAELERFCLDPAHFLQANMK